MTKDDVITEVAKVLVGEGRPLGRVDAEAVLENRDRNSTENDQ